MIRNHIECISLTRQYISKNEIVTAVDNVDLTVGRNELVLLKGRSGAGKSTLLHLMCGLIKPTKGKVIIDGLSIGEMTDNSLSALLSERIGIIFQAFNLLPTYTVYENIEIALVPKGQERTVARDKIHSLLEQFGLKNKAYLLPSSLSAGQQQKVAIIRSLVKDPSILFADEPTGSVDEDTAAEIIDHLLGMKRNKELTLVIATHGNVAEKFADRVFNIVNGRIRTD